MNALRKEDENLSTADLVNPGRNRDNGPMTPRQAYAAGEPVRNDTYRNDPPDYTPPPQQAQNTPEPVVERQANRGPQPVATRIPAAAPVAPVPAPAPASRNPAPPPARPMPVAQNPQPSGPSNPVANAGGPRSAALFPEDELHNFRARWDQVQTSFVDEPRRAVEQADSLVANVVKRIAEQFANERETLERQWDRGDDVNTEDLRQALKRYRSFFDRLLSV